MSITLVDPSVEVELSLVGLTDGKPVVEGRRAVHEFATNARVRRDSVDYEMQYELPPVLGPAPNRPWYSKFSKKKF
jgi:hypothetical protein